MTTEQQINLQIQKEYDAFNSSPYSSEPPLPKYILELFEKAIFKLAPATHRHSTDLIKKILGKKVKELNNMDVPIILNTITLAPLSELYKDMDEALIKNKVIDELKISYNLTVKQINEQMEQKRLNLISLSTGKPLQRGILAKA